MMASNEEKANDGMLSSGSENPTPVKGFLNASNISLIGDVALNFGGSGAKLLDTGKLFP
jgi:hypothetical protein